MFPLKHLCCSVSGWCSTLLCAFLFRHSAPGRFSDGIWFGVCECDELTNSRLSSPPVSWPGRGECAVWSTSFGFRISKMSCVTRLSVSLVDKTLSASSSLHLFLHIPLRPLHLFLSLSLPPSSRLPSSPLDCCSSPSSSSSFFLHTFFAAVAASVGHNVVVAARRLGLLASGGSHRLLPHHRPALQGVQREEPEASGAVGDGQQTERRQAEERWENFNWYRRLWPLLMCMYGVLMCEA